LNEDRWKIRSPTNDQLGVGIADYLNELEAVLKIAGPQAVLLGHSMGAVLAQQLAAKGLARAIVLVSPAPRAGHVAA
jgi:non-heme chloroperoxidase